MHDDKRFSSQDTAQLGGNQHVEMVHLSIALALLGGRGQTRPIMELPCILMTSGGIFLRMLQSFMALPSLRCMLVTEECIALNC